MATIDQTLKGATPVAGQVASPTTNMSQQMGNNDTTMASPGKILINNGEKAGKSKPSDENPTVQGYDQEWEEIQKLQDLHDDTEFGSLLQQGGTPATSGTSTDPDSDARSVYVGNVDYSSTPGDLQEHFKSCGTINRITIMVDKFTGHPKGFAYIEFNSEAAAQNAVLLSDTIFKERPIKVVLKRKNIPGMARGRGGFRGRGAPAFRGRGRGGMFRPMYRGRGGMARGYGRPY